MAFSDWQTDPSANTTVSGVNIAENCPPGNVNNGIRAVMADLRSAFASGLASFLSGASPLALASGGTGANTAPAARAALGLGDAATRPASDFATAAAFAALAGQFSSGSNGNGYWSKRPDGNGGAIIEQWGTNATFASEGPINQTFPIAFTDLASINVQLTIVSSGSPNNDMWVQGYTTSLTNFSAFYQAPSSGNAGSGFRWRAIGR